MLLITHFWHAFLLVNLVLSGFPQGTKADGYCWKVDPEEQFWNLEYCKTPGWAEATCGVDKATGFGVGCIKNDSYCPPKDPDPNKRHDMICVPNNKLCCCFSTVCNYVERGRQACELPEFKDKNQCKEQIFCRRSGEASLELCGDNPEESPYCTLDPKTGLSTGCRKAYPLAYGCSAIPGAKDLPFGSELVCNDKLCCCKGTPAHYKACNKLTPQACQLKELAHLEECGGTTMMNSSIPGTGNSSPTDATDTDYDGESGSESWTGGLFLMVLEIAMVYMMF